MRSVMSHTPSTPSQWCLHNWLPWFDPEKMAAICGFWTMFPLCESVVDLSGLSLPGHKQQVLVLSFCSRWWVVHLAMSSSAMGEAVWVVVSIKSCPLTGSDSMQPNRAVWGHQLVDPRWITPKPQTTSQLVNVTCSCSVSLSSTTLPAKGQRSELSSGLTFSAQYCSPLA